ncbi:MAG: VTT domain-containing protein [Rhizobiaceae bacterium]|nr:VTT domain-containing protein [Rhizobiaceae bacterium]MCV0405700.1 VTT domain-containing protein [Rhizobiaceae bacterium]
MGEAMEECRPRRPIWLRYLPIAVVAAGLALGYAMGWHRFLTLDYLVESRETLTAARLEHPVLSAAAFFAAYVAAVAFSFPAASVLTIFGGFLFGWLAAGIMVAFAATLGATILFLAARSACGDALKSRAGSKLARISDGFKKDAFTYLLILRLAPVFPFFLVNIAPAFANVRLSTYVGATFLGILPGVFAYAYLGHGIDSVIAAAHAAGSDLSIGDLVTPKITIAFAALALVAAIPLVIKRMSRRARR